MRHFAVLLTAALALLGASNASAATTIYTDSSNFGAWPNAVNAGNSLGPANGVSATVPNFGWIAYQVNPTVTAGNVLLTLTSVTGSGSALFYVGTSNGAGFFSALNNRAVTLTTGPNLLALSAAQSAFCVGLGGCDVFIVQAFGGGTSLAIDRALGPNPEPAAWALMILGFAGVAARLKQLRRSKATPLALMAAPA